MSTRPESQFGAPRGMRGWVAAQVVSRLTGDANRWMVECLDLRGDDRVLDVGCGPGLGIALAAEVAGDGLVVGIDASPTMVRQAARRNRATIRSGRLDVVRAEAGRLPFPDGYFGKAWTLNSMQFWPEPGAGLRELRRVLLPDARTVVGLMARSDDPPAAAGPPSWLTTTARLMTDAGLGDVRFETRAFGGILHWALLAARPAPCVPAEVGEGRAHEPPPPIDRG